MVTVSSSLFVVEHMIVFNSAAVASFMLGICGNTSLGCVVLTSKFAKNEMGEAWICLFFGTSQKTQTTHKMAN